MIATIIHTIIYVHILHTAGGYTDTDTDTDTETDTHQTQTQTLSLSHAHTHTLKEQKKGAQG